MIQRKNWTLASPETKEAALKYAKGCYQREIILGAESLSGSTLKGKASAYSARYKASSGNLLDRLKRVGFKIDILTSERGARLLRIRSASDE
jgi:hypothetical protein